MAGWRGCDRCWPDKVNQPDMLWHLKLARPLPPHLLLPSPRLWPASKCVGVPGVCVAGAGAGGCWVATRTFQTRASCLVRACWRRRLGTGRGCSDKTRRHDHRYRGYRGYTGYRAHPTPHTSVPPPPPHPRARCLRVNSSMYQGVSRVYLMSMTSQATLVINENVSSYFRTFSLFLARSKGTLSSLVPSNPSAPQHPLQYTPPFYK